LPRRPIEPTRPCSAKSSRFQSVAQLDHRRRVPLAASRTCYYPAHWRDAWQIEHSLGKYIISDKPVSEEQWTKERATLIDVTPDDEKKEGPLTLG
jgi:hypothetical protein